MPLSSPVSSICIQRSAGALGRVAVASCQGVRANHEDGHIVNHGLGIVGVFDGHVGDEAATFASERMHLHIRAQGNAAPSKVLPAAYLTCEDDLRKHLPDGCEAGTTAAVALLRIEGSRINIALANAGDCRTILWRKATGAFETTRDHRPDDAGEKARIEGAGGTVDDSFDPPRVDGKLACSRALASFAYKTGSSDPAKQKVSCVPDMYEWSAEAGDFLIQACDGIFDVFSNEQVIKGICGENKKDDLGASLSELCELCLKKEGDDNMTVLAVELGSVAPEEERTELSAGNYLKTKDKEVLEQYVSFAKKCGYELKKEMVPKAPPKVVVVPLPPQPGRFDGLPEPAAVAAAPSSSGAPAVSSDGPSVLKVTTQRPFYVFARAARQLLEGAEGNPPLSELEITALGNAVPVAASVVAALLKEGFGTKRVETGTVTVTPTRQGRQAKERQTPSLRVFVSRN